MGLLDGLFGGDKKSTTIPDWMAGPAKSNIAAAQRIAGAGYMPYYGPDVAAFTPMQNAAFDGTNQAAAAFGMPTAQGNGMPKPQTFAGGVQGYSSAPMYSQAVAALKKNNPKQYAALMAVLQGFTKAAQPPAPVGIQQMGGNSGGGNGGYYAPASGGGSFNTIGSYLPGGVNTNNPGSFINQALASITSSPQRAPTSSDRPKARP